VLGVGANCLHALGNAVHEVLEMCAHPVEHALGGHHESAIERGPCSSLGKVLLGALHRVIELGNFTAPLATLCPCS
jgi:hypothetical protein